MSTIYVIVGSTGEYSDQRQWLVCAYYDEQLAQEHVIAATKWAHAEHVRRDGIEWPDPLVELPSPYDPGIKIDYTGTQYRYDAVPVRDALPQEATTQQG